MAEIKRYPIIIDSSSIAVITIFTAMDPLEDVWMTDYIENGDTQINGAKQFISQLKGHWTPRFLMELRKEITEALQEHDNYCGTSFAKEQI